MKCPAVILADQLQRVFDGAIALEDVINDPGNQGEYLGDHAIIRDY